MVINGFEWFHAKIVGFKRYKRRRLNSSFLLSKQDAHFTQKFSLLYKRNTYMFTCQKIQSDFFFEFEFQKCIYIIIRLMMYNSLHNSMLLSFPKKRLVRKSLLINHSNMEIPVFFVKTCDGQLMCSYLLSII